MVARTGFPVERLLPVQGILRAMIFEDAVAGVEQDLYWGIDIEFAPLRYRGERIQPSLSCEWMLLGIMDWKHLEGAELAGDYDQIEASFQVWEHDFARSSRIRFLQRDETSFRVRYDMVVDFTGIEGEDADPELPVSAELTLPYLGFAIDRNILPGRPENEAQAREIAALYADLRCYRSPRLDSGVFHFDPVP